MNNKKQTCIYLSPEELAMKKEIESLMDGGTLTHSTIYRRGLVSFKELMEKKITIRLDNAKE